MSIMTETAVETPDLDGFETYYGVRISSCGEDGDVIALGHVEPRRFVAAHLRYCRQFLGYDLTLESGARYVTEGIEHVWMHDDPDEAKRQGSHWWLGIVAEDTPGAFPVTYWSN